MGFKVAHRAWQPHLPQSAPQTRAPHGYKERLNRTDPADPCDDRPCKMHGVDCTVRN